MAKIGAHVSSSLSIDLSIDRAKNIGAQCSQIFITPPQQWAQGQHSQEDIDSYNKKAREEGIGPNFIHGVYLINLATQSPENSEKAIDWLSYSLKRAGDLGMAGTIFHLGSHKGKGFESVEKQICEALEKILSQTPKETNLILENSAGAGGCVGAHFSELGRLLKQVRDARLKICLDTQHAFAMGYEVNSLIGLKSMLEEFEEEIGLKNLEVIHLNDSKTEFKSNRDRHENIGEGFIGIEAFENIVNNPRLKEIPFILEVPGFAGNGPDKENVEKVKSLLKV